MDRLLRIVEKNGYIVLDELGNATELESAAGDLARSPYAPLVAKALIYNEVHAGDFSPYGPTLIGFAQLLHDQKSYLALRETSDLLLSSNPIRRMIAKVLHDSMMPDMNTISQDPLLSALRLEVCLDLVRAEKLPRYELLRVLTQSVADLPSDYTDKIAPLIGVAADTWTNADDYEVFASTLESLCAIKADDSAFELSLHSLRLALQQPQPDLICNGIRIALERMESVVLREEGREDAKGYVAACRAVLAFHVQDAEALKEASKAALKNAQIKNLLLHGMHNSPRTFSLHEAELAWHSLAWRLQTAIEQLEHEEFLDTWTAIDSLIDVYSAERLLHSTSALAVVLQPQIENRLSTRFTMLRQLQRAIDSDKSRAAPLLAPAAYKLLEMVQRHQNSRDRSSADDTQESSLTPEFATKLGLRPELFSDLSIEEVHHLNIVSSQLTVGHLGQQEPLANATLDPIFSNLLTELEKNPHFSESRGANFSLLARLTLRFLALVGDQAQPFTKPFSERSEAPKESELQDAFYQCLALSELAGRVGVEHPNIANGRADIIVTFDAAERYVTEVKRELDNATRHRLEEKYLAQAFEYQATNVPLGQLLVLDLTNHSSGTPHISDSIWVSHRLSQSGEVSQSIVVAVVRGNRPTPSQMR